MRCVTLVLLAGLAACGDDPQVPTDALPVGNLTVGATVATTVGTAPSVRITDAKGKGIRNVLVRWKVTSGGGKVVNDSIRTTASGEASSGGWTLGTTSGEQTLQASAEGIAPVTFTATAAPGPLARFTRVSPDVQSAEVNTAVTTPPSVRTEDQYGNPVPSVSVVFSVTLGGGTLTGNQQTSNAQGVASVAAWRLGTTAGQQIVTASTSGIESIVFGATALAGPAASLTKIAGDDQEAVANAAVPVRPGVRAVDAFGNPVGNVPVTFTPGPSSGTVTGATTATDLATGSAFVGSWTIGSSATQTLTATSSMLPSASVTFTARAVNSLFDIDVRFVGEGGSTIVREAFTKAAERWRSIIVSDMHNTRINVPAGSCAIDAAHRRGRQRCRDLRAHRHDRRPGQHPRSGRSLFREHGIASVGRGHHGVRQGRHGHAHRQWQFHRGDSARDGTCARHRHALELQPQPARGRGAAPIRTSRARPDAPVCSHQHPRLSGNPVPVENSGGAGTRDSHWRETVLLRELMTGFLNRNVTNPLSRLTIGSLQDLGYTVNLNAADPYSLTAQLRYAFPFVESEVTTLHNDIADLPLYEITPSGARTLVRASARSR